MFLNSALENLGLVEQIRNNSTAVNELHGQKRPEPGYRLMFRYARVIAKLKKKICKAIA